MCVGVALIPALKGRAKFKPPLRGDDQTLPEFLDGRFFGQSRDMK